MGDGGIQDDFGIGGSPIIQPTPMVVKTIVRMMLVASKLRLLLLLLLVTCPHIAHA